MCFSCYTHIKKPDISDIIHLYIYTYIYILTYDTYVPVLYQWYYLFGSNLPPFGFASHSPRVAPSWLPWILHQLIGSLFYPFFTGSYRFQVLQDFFHQQYSIICYDMVSSLYNINQYNTRIVTNKIYMSSTLYYDPFLFLPYSIGHLVYSCTGFIILNLIPSNLILDRVGGHAFQNLCGWFSQPLVSSFEHPNKICGKLWRGWLCKLMM